MSKIIEGANEALAVARGEKPAPRIRWKGHAYVAAPEYDLSAPWGKAGELLSEMLLHHSNRTAMEVMRGKLNDILREYAFVIVPEAEWNAGQAALHRKVVRTASKPIVIRDDTP